MCPVPLEHIHISGKTFTRNFWKFTLVDKVVFQTIGTKKKKKTSLIKARNGFKIKILLKKCYVQITKLTKSCSIKSIYFIFTFENIF